MQFLKSVKTTNAITLKVVSCVPRFFYWHSRQPNSLLTGLWNTLLLCLQCHDATWPFLSFHFFKAWHYKNSCGQAHVDVRAQMKQTQTELRAGHSGSTISWAFLFPLCSRSLGNHDKNGRNEIDSKSVIFAQRASSTTRRYNMAKILGTPNSHKNKSIASSQCNLLVSYAHMLDLLSFLKVSPYKLSCMHTANPSSLNFRNVC